MENQSNGHADLRAFISSIDTRLGGIEESIRECRGCIVSKQECDEKHKHIVDKRYFNGVVSALLFLAAVGGVIIKLTIG